MKKKLWGLLAALMLLTGLPAAAQAANLAVHYIDVGQGDSAFLELPNRKTMLIDAGENNSKAAQYIKKLGYTSIDYVVATHPDSDHIGGMTEVINSFTIDDFYMPNKGNTTKTYENMLDALENRHVDCYYAQAGTKLCSTSDLTVQCFSPIAGVNYGSNTNDYSAVMKVTYGSTSFLFTGDAETDAEQAMLSKYSASALKSTVLKVAHHGSSGATSSKFLNAVAPQYAVISVGKNTYGHPTKTILDRLNNAGVSYYRTDLDGTITFTSTGSKVSTTAKANNGTSSPTKLSKPTSVKASRASTSSIQVSWATVPGASGYYVYRSSSAGSGYTKIKTTTSTRYTNTGLTANKTYYYKIKAYANGGKTVSAASSAASAKTTIPAVTGVSVSKASATSAKVSWNKASGVSGYQVVRATSQSGSYSAVKYTSAVSFTNTGLKAGKTYYYKVRAYKTVSGKKIYGTYSSVKSIKMSSAFNNNSGSTGGTVYITSTGKRYHRIKNCGNGTYTATSLAHAKSLGLTPCQKCW